MLLAADLMSNMQQLHISSALGPWMQVGPIYKFDEEPQEIQNIIQVHSTMAGRGCSKHHKPNLACLTSQYIQAAHCPIPLTGIALPCQDQKAHAQPMLAPRTLERNNLPISQETYSNHEIQALQLHQRLHSAFEVVRHARS